jgi:hypothetical protein
MSPFGGKADIGGAAAMSPSDPKETYIDGLFPFPNSLLTWIKFGIPAHAYREWRSIEGNGRRDPLVLVALIKIEMIRQIRRQQCQTISPD